MFVFHVITYGAKNELNNTLKDTYVLRVVIMDIESKISFNSSHIVMLKQKYCMQNQIIMICTCIAHKKEEKS